MAAKSCNSSKDDESWLLPVLKHHCSALPLVDEDLAALRLRRGLQLPPGTFAESYPPWRTTRLDVTSTKIYSDAELPPTAELRACSEHSADTEEKPNKMDAAVVASEASPLVKLHLSAAGGDAARPTAACLSIWLDPRNTRRSPRKSSSDIDAAVPWLRRGARMVCCAAVRAAETTVLLAAAALCATAGAALTLHWWRMFSPSNLIYYPWIAWFSGWGGVFTGVYNGWLIVTLLRCALGAASGRGYVLSPPVAVELTLTDQEWRLRRRRCWGPDWWTQPDSLRGHIDDVLGARVRSV